MIDALYPKGDNVPVLLPGGMYISLIQCLFDNDSTYTDQSQLTLIDTSTIKYSCFLKDGQSFYEKHGFQYYTHQSLEDIRKIVDATHTHWNDIKKTLCITQHFQNAP